jgi:hypothetical protein
MKAGVQHNKEHKREIMMLMRGTQERDYDADERNTRER